MYIKSFSIAHIRAIELFDMTFKNPAGWHVLIGDNGAGKSSIIRSLALALLGEDDAKALAFSEDFATWLPPKINVGSIKIVAERDKVYDMPKYNGKKLFKTDILIERLDGNGKVSISGNIDQQTALWGKNAMSGWFVAAYGPFRRLRGNSSASVSSRPRLNACLTAFRDDVALTQLTEWLKNLALDAKKKKEAKKTLEGIINFINHSKLLPNGATLTDDIDSDGIKLIDGNGIRVSLQEMSDGFRSVLSMILDIIRYMVEVYGNKVFKEEEVGTIDLPGVVLIDEIDAHLHPTWQTRIGEWFTRFFPNIQFIVTTHSPLVCRACEKGSIWRLAAPGSATVSGEITGTDRQRLIFGNVLDAYGTEVFGEAVSQSQHAEVMIRELARLNVKSFKGIIVPEEKQRMMDLQKILPTT